MHVTILLTLQTNLKTSLSGALEPMIRRKLYHFLVWYFPPGYRSVNPVDHYGFSGFRSSPIRAEADHLLEGRRR